MASSAAIVERWCNDCPRPGAAIAADLESFALLIEKWRRVKNLVSRETGRDLWERHIADSLQILPLLRATDQRVVDLGSGGGFPAIPLAIAFKGGTRQITMMESDGRKVSFLRTAIRELELPANVIGGRIEAHDSRETADVITARALAPLADLFILASNISSHNTHLLLHKGRNWRSEVAECHQAWRWDMVIHESATESGAVLLDISNLLRIQ